MGEESVHFDMLLDILEDLEDKNEKFLKNPTKSERPLIQAFESLIEACCFPIKSDKIDKFLEAWIVSARWTERAKLFLQDKLSED